MPDDPLAVARAVASAVRDVPGIAGLDPGSRLATRTGSESVTGAWMRPTADVLGMELEVVGLAGAELPDAVARTRQEAARVPSAHGWRAGRIDVTVSDVSFGTAPPVRDEDPPVADEQPASPAPAPARALRLPAELPEGRAQARVTVEHDGRPLRLLITVEVEEVSG